MIYRVVVPSNVYESKPPYESCRIIKKTEKEHPLEVGVFEGTYEQCVEYCKKNCKKCS